MSGNSTRLAVDGARGSPAARLAGGLVAAFVTGVVGGFAGAFASSRLHLDAVWLAAAAAALLAVVAIRV